jgi:hypoxanthine phosphoribosyltransferase
LYEPRTFPLYWDDEHRIIEAFTPDFYLPEQDLYVELTTLRPQLTNHKHRKMRRMHELYPDVKIKLMKRRDLRDLMRKYGFHDQAAEIDGRSAQNGG